MKTASPDFANSVAGQAESSPAPRPCIIPVVLCGGSGTRLWPLSRASHPKPFIPLPDGETLLEKTLKRLQGLGGVGTTLIVTNREYYFQTRDTVQAVHGAIDGPASEQPDIHYLLEPVGRNTAPAIAAAALWAEQVAGPQAVLLVLPADHVIANAIPFGDAVERAVVMAGMGRLVTFGIPPDRAETGYGYIETGSALDAGFEVAQFTEKPDAVTAEAFVADGRHLWNAGMFAFQVGTLLQSMAECAPEVLHTVQPAWQQAVTQDDRIELPASFGQAPDLSIDYAVMERSGNVAVIPAVDLGWSDVGSWLAFAELIDPDRQGNRAEAHDAVLIDAENCFVYSPERICAMLGVNDLMVVDTPDALLVAHASRAQDVKQVVALLRARRHGAANLHRTVHRPWGTYTVLEEGQGFKIKRIVVKPGASLSLQMHHHRSEHWVVVSGTASIVNGGEERYVRTNESTFIPPCTQHRLLNPGVVDLVMIEVQSGEYLGEDDIVRFDDRYGRHSPGA